MVKLNRNKSGTLQNVFNAKQEISQKERLKKTRAKQKSHTKMAGINSTTVVK